MLLVEERDSWRTTIKSALKPTTEIAVDRYTAYKRSVWRDGMATAAEQDINTVSLLINSGCWDISAMQGGRFRDDHTPMGRQAYCRVDAGECLACCVARYLKWIPRPSRDIRGAQREGMLAVEISRTFIGVSSSGKTQHFDCCIRRFESCHPCHYMSEYSNGTEDSLKNCWLNCLWVRIPSPIPLSGCSAVGSARHLGCRCRRFEPCHPDQYIAEW